MATRQERNMDPIRLGVGLRLRAARKGKRLTQDDVADHYGVKKATVSAWETGRGDPGVYRLLELCELYGVPADAILQEDSLTPDAMKVAVEFDSLNDEKQRLFRTLWMAYLKEVAGDAQVESKMPITKNLRIANETKPAPEASIPATRKPKPGRV